MVKNGMVCDGTGLPRYLADLAVKDGKIVEKGKIGGQAGRARGYEYLIVNGQVTLEQGKPSGKLAGKLLRSTACRNQATSGSGSLSTGGPHMANPTVPGLSRREIMPIPPVDKNTDYIKAGPVSIGVEFRFLTRQMIIDEFKKQNLEHQAPAYETLRDEKGVSLHVMIERQPGKLKEIVRFDCFEDGPHYHYICWADENPGDNDHALVTGIDPFMHGEPIPFAVEKMRTRLPLLLEYAGVKDIAKKVEGNKEFLAALPKVLAVAQQKKANAAALGAAEIERKKAEVAAVQKSTVYKAKV